MHGNRRSHPIETPVRSTLLRIGTPDGLDRVALIAEDQPLVRKKCRMHILDDPVGLTLRARSLLCRTGWREPSQEPRPAIELPRTRNRFGEPIPPPTMLVIRREGFERRYGGLCYQVRNSYAAGSERREQLRSWHFDLGQNMWSDSGHGWYFDWLGERVSSPVRYLMHTDGRVGVEDGSGAFIEIAPSARALIESHALTDLASTWDRADTLDIDSFALAQRLCGLTEIPEASGRTIKWRASRAVAVMEFQEWSSEEPRRWRAFIWSRDKVGRHQIGQAIA
ncbi:hypothetical protein [Streptomyces sp. IBSBF 2806]|uniref:hypothetical protein n=1 Tax=Streptomyces sp. IBSBF 2806 TaxID=2903529 RepID=UPI002FDBC244